MKIKFLSHVKSLPTNGTHLIFANTLNTSIFYQLVEQLHQQFWRSRVFSLSQTTHLNVSLTEGGLVSRAEVLDEFIQLTKVKIEQI